METIAIIPARKGSKRVPGKNTSLFKGRSLIANTIEQSLVAGVFDKIFISTDDEKVVNIAKDYNVEVLIRGDDLASDNATLLDVTRDIIVQKNIRPEVCIGLLLVTVPLRAVEDIKNAYDLFLKSNRKQAVISVCSYINPIDLAWSIRDDYLQPVFPEKYKKNISKHFREHSYYFNDACVFDLADNFLRKNRNLFGNNPLPYIMPHERSLFIDYDFQLKLIQLLGKNQE